ncbi:hypothetical protein LZ318_40575 [Saccharopolyspora indica]|uniref:hypothetical protein n=1 Tax=Saccharopolyspora indica TaxID=1229659 RepID=UPI0022EB747B|nr:hypothetical protein [Saccharopolyspora indica]MDA3646914.1 hypothetical protein [Saccharopolyspora indica]
MPPEPHRNEHAGAVRGPMVQAGTIVGDVHFHRRRPRRGSRWRAPAAVGSVLLAGLAGLIGGGWWTEAALLLGAGSPLEWWLIRRAIRPATGADPLDEALSGLRQQVRRQWTEERDNRGLQDPRPLRLRWRPTERPVQVRLTAAERGRAEQRQGELLQAADETAPAAAALLTAFQQDTRRQLVVLGERGAGKSTLALLFTLVALDDAARPVPVLLSVAGWNPKERIEDWIARRISEDYPAVSLRQVEHLLADRRLLPVLDGLDEVPPRLLERALHALNRAAVPEMVITCRSAEFEAAVSRGGALVHATVVEIEPVKPEDAREFFEQRDLEGAQRWDDVVDTMADRPDGPLARLLSTPLMIILARRAYRRPGSRPDELAEFGTAEEAEAHLLSEFLPAVYPDERYRVKAQRWLVFLAHHLDRQGNPDFEWWRLARAMPRWLIPTVVAGVLTGVFFLAVPDDNYLYTPNPAVALPLVVMIGVHVGRVSRLPAAQAQRSPVRALGGRMLRNAAVAGLAAVAMALLFIAAVHFSGSLDGKAAIYGYLNRLSFESAAVDLIFSISIIGSCAVSSLYRAGMPQRVVPRLRTLLPALGVGLGVGLLSGVLVWLFFFVGKLRFLTIAPDSADVVSTTAFSSTAVSLIFAVFVGLPIGAARWLASPSSVEVGNSPRAVLRGDRAAMLLATLVSGVPLLGLVFGAWSVEDNYRELFTACGVLVMAAVLCCSGSAWVSYTIARSWLAVRGQLPWRLTAFLRNAHAIGVLRQAGSAYQLRHDVLRAHLAVQHPGHHRETPSPRAKFGWTGVGIVASLVVLGGVTAAFLPAGAPREFAAPVNPYNDAGLDRSGYLINSDDGKGAESVVDLLSGDSFPLPEGGSVHSAQISPDGSRIALSLRVGGDESLLEVREVAGGRVVRSVPVPLWGIVKYGPGGKSVAVVNPFRRSAITFDVESGKWAAAATAPLPGGPVSPYYWQLVESSDFESLLLVNARGELWKWGYLSGISEKVADNACAPAGPCRVSVADGGQVVVTSRNEGIIKNISSGATLHITDVTGLVRALDSWELSADGRTLFTYAAGGVVRAWDVPAF